MKNIIIRIFTDPDWAMVFWQAASVFVSLGGFGLLFIQIRKTDKHIREEAIRSVWATLRAERQRMEADVTQIDIQKEELDRRRRQVADGAHKVSKLSEALEELYPEIFHGAFKGRDAIVDNSNEGA